MQQATDMRGVILHTEAPFNQPSHPWTGPQVCRQPGDLSTLDEHSTQAREIAAPQAPRATGSRLGSNGRLSAFAGGCFPASNTAPIDTDLTRHLDWGKPFIEQA